MTTSDSTALSKAISHALRHDPWHYGLEPDAAGWVSVSDLVTALNPAFPEVGIDDIAQVVDDARNGRHEVLDGRVRARYGHSWVPRVDYPASAPPVRLWHGTTMSAWQGIRTEGLLPEGRQYVHLSTDAATARRVARRRRPPHVLVVVDAPAAHLHGICFYQATAATWLADEVPPDFLHWEPAH